MLVSDNFSMRLSPEEKLMLSRIAQRAERSQAGLLRKLIRDTYRAMEQEAAREEQPS